MENLEDIKFEDACRPEVQKLLSSKDMENVYRAVVQNKREEYLLLSSIRSNGLFVPTFQFLSYLGTNNEPNESAKLHEQCEKFAKKDEIYAIRHVGKLKKITTHGSTLYRYLADNGSRYQAIELLKFRKSRTKKVKEK